MPHRQKDNRWLAGFVAVMMAMRTAAAPPDGPSAPASAPADPSLVQVIVTYQERDPFLPWQLGQPQTRVGYGVLVNPSQVITTESLVRNHRLVELRRPRSGEKIPVVVDLADYQVNLALLRLPDAKVGEALVPVSLAARVASGDRVDILQFDETAAVQKFHANVMQMRVGNLPLAPHSSLLFSLLCEVNVAAEGAPVLLNGQLAGLIVNFDRNTRTADLLPYPVVRAFIEDASTAPYEGIGSAGFQWTTLVDPAKRAYLNVGHEGQGILVLSCLPGTSACEVLKPSDVILEWDGCVVDNLGFYRDPDFGRLSFPYLIMGRRKPGDLIPVKIVREGRETTVSLKLARRADGDALIPEDVTGEQAEYLVAGGLIIRELSGRYLRSHGAKWHRSVDPRLVHLYLTKQSQPERPGDRIVILSSVLPDPVNSGYEKFQNQIIVAVNGKPVSNMSDVFKIADADGGLERLSLESVDVDIYLDREQLAAADRRLSALYRIPSLRFQKK